MWEWTSRVSELVGSEEPFVLATIVNVKGSTPRELGARMLIFRDGRFERTIGGGKFESLVIQEAKKLFDTKRSLTLKFPLGAKAGQCCGGSVEVFFELLNDRPSLYLFGAGHVGQEVCKVLESTPFSVHLVDERKQWVLSDAVPRTVKCFHGEWENFIENVRWNSEDTYVVIMTHRHDRDQEILESVLKLESSYVGLIGSQSKWERFKQRLIHKGVEPEKLERVYCPIGLVKGGKTPREVAISLAAQLLKVYHEKKEP